MSDTELKDTQPNGAVGPSSSESDPGDTQPNSIKRDTQPRQKDKKFPRWLVALCVVTLIAIGLLAGYSSGMGQRYAAKNTLVAGQLGEQFALGQQAYDAKNYELARTYFEGVIRTDPNYPGIVAAYSDTILQLQVTPTPVFSPTPVISPTPDLRGAEEIYNTALQLLNSSDWQGALTNLDALRKSNPEYRTAEVDGMYYSALRQLGVQQITTSCADVNLEGGIYDLTLAERFVGEGNLDSYAESLRTYARLYIIGASFWDQDWFQAQSFFAQVVAAYPNMTDSSCISATNRWVLATLKWADQLASGGSFCDADNMYATAFMVNSSYNATAYPVATDVRNKCAGDGGGGGGGDGSNGTSETPTSPSPTSPAPEVTPTESLTPGP
jgi:tetratricopeptide (TPR) repeat protein